MCQALQRAAAAGWEITQRCVISVKALQIQNCLAAFFSVDVSPISKQTLGASKGNIPLYQATLLGPVATVP